MLLIFGLGYTARRIAAAWPGAVMGTTRDGRDGSRDPDDETHVRDRLIALAFVGARAELRLAAARCAAAALRAQLVVDRVRLQTEAHEHTRADQCDAARHDRGGARPTRRLLGHFLLRRRDDDGPHVARREPGVERRHRPEAQAAVEPGADLREQRHREAAGGAHLLHHRANHRRRVTAPAQVLLGEDRRDGGRGPHVGARARGVDEGLTRREHRAARVAPPPRRHAATRPGMPTESSFALDELRRR